MSSVDLPSENAALRERLDEMEAVLAAVRSGAVDAVMVGGPGQQQVYTLKGAETPYRQFVETMHEGAATLDAQGCVVYANEALARMLARPLRSVMGSLAVQMAVAEDRDKLAGLLRAGEGELSVELLAADGSSVPALANVAQIVGNGGKRVLVLTDLREHERGAAARARLKQSERSRRALLSLLEDQTRTEQSLRRTNRALKTLSAGNEALVRAIDEASLLREMTRILCEVGGYPVAFVAYADRGTQRAIEIKACIGIDEAVLHRASIASADDVRGQSAVARAIRLGQTQLTRGAADAAAYAPWAEFLKAKRIKATLGLPLRLAAGEPVLGAIGIAASEEDAFDAGAVRLLEELAGDLAYGIANLRAGVEQRSGAAKLRRALESTIEAIAATMETRDPYTAGHQRRVAALAAAIAAEMGLPAHMVEGIHFGALIHDLGKIQVPAEILAKPTRLTKLEFELIKVHPQAGYDIIKGVDFPWPVALMVLQHHERIDGSGYPQGLKGEQMIPEARILAVADVVEAMSSHRPYRAGLGIEAALKEVETKRGTWFEPAAVDACLRLFREKNFGMASA